MVKDDTTEHTLLCDAFFSHTGTICNMHGNRTFTETIAENTKAEAERRTVLYAMHVSLII